MGMEIAQVSFNAGEISPALYARTNLEKYGSAAKILLNFYVKKEGGLDKRPGSWYVGGVQNNGYPSRLRRFQFSQDQGYALEFGNKVLSAKAAWWQQRTAPNRMSWKPHMILMKSGR